MNDELVAGCQLLDLAVRGDDRGSLIALECGNPVGFPIERVYYIFGTNPGVSRGFHGHRTLRQIAVCVAGACTLLLDDGHSRIETRLDDPSKAVSIGPMIWREIHDFTPDCVLMVLASQRYNEGDYLRSYDDFRAAVAFRDR